MATPVQTPSTPDTQTFAGAAAAGYQEGLHPTPKKPAPAGVAGAAGNVVGQTAAAASEGAGVVSGVLHNAGEVADDVAKKGKSFWESLDIGKILGGILGLGGAFFLGNMFGEGMFSTILMVCLAIPLMCIGSNQFGSMINGWMGKKQPDAQQPERTPEVAVSQPGIAQSQGAAPATVQTTPSTQAPHQGNGQQVLAAPDHPVAAGFQTTLSEVEMNAMLDNARKAGKPTARLVIGAPDKQAHIPVETIREDFAQCRAHGYDSVLGLTQNPTTGNITPTCLPLPPTASSPRRN